MANINKLSCKFAKKVLNFEVSECLKKKMNQIISIKENWDSKMMDDIDMDQPAE